jgi:trk system potassium uptake protein TrkA
VLPKVWSRKRTTLRSSIPTGVRLAQLQDRLDLRTVVGNGAVPSVMRSAGAEDADMLIAVTQSDQTNLVACKLAHSVFNVPKRIARLRSRDFLEDASLLSPEKFAVDFALCPEQVITDYIRRLIEFPEALQVLNFAKGRVSLVAVRAYEGRLAGWQADQGNARTAADRNGCTNRRHFPPRPAGFP